MGRILSRILELTQPIEPGVESRTHFVFVINTVAMGRILSRTQLVGLYLRFLNLLFNVVDVKTKLRYLVISF